jgi:hypothetical protein
MYDSASSLPPLIPPETRKHSRIGITSFGIGIVAVLIFCLAILLAFVYVGSAEAQNLSFQVDQGSPAILALGLLLLISPILSLVGSGLGFVALLQKNDRRLFGIIGFVLNLLIVLVFCILFAIGIVGQSGSLGL